MNNKNNITNQLTRIDLPDQLLSIKDSSNRVGRDESMTIQFLWDIQFKYNSKEKIIFYFNEQIGLPVFQSNKVQLLSSNRKVILDTESKKQLINGQEYNVNGILIYCLADKTNYGIFKIISI